MVTNTFKSTTENDEMFVWFINFSKGDEYSTYHDEQSHYHGDKQQHYRWFEQFWQHPFQNNCPFRRCGQTIHHLMLNLSQDTLWIGNKTWVFCSAFHPPSKLLTVVYSFEIINQAQNVLVALRNTFQDVDFVTNHMLTTLHQLFIDDFTSIVLACIDLYTMLQ